MKQWRYIETKKYPAHYTSCGLTQSHSQKVKSWKSDLEFLWEKESKWPNLENHIPGIANEDQEEKTAVSINAVRIEGDILSNMVELISTWKKLLQVIVFVMKFVKRLKKISADGNILTVEDLRTAEVIVFQHYQEK